MAFRQFYDSWREQNPHEAREYMPFDVQDFFYAGYEAYRDAVWHTHEEVAEEGQVIIIYNPCNCTLSVSYGGGQVDCGEFWAYARSLFSEEMMEVMMEREASLRAFLEEEKVRRMADDLEDIPI